MLGLRADLDSSGLRPLLGAVPGGGGGGGRGGTGFDTSLGAGGANHKSHKFASQLAGRFFVSGISGGFEKHTRGKDVTGAGAGATGAPAQRPKVAEEIFKQRQAREIRDDAKRLLEMEEQLREIQQRRELRRRRDRERRKKKLEFQSACIIQRAVRYFFGTKLRNAVDVLVAFIRTNRASNALAIGAWAAGTIRRFAVTASVRFLERKRQKMEEEKAAYERWSQMQKAIAATAQSRRNASNTFVGDCVRQGLLRAMTLRIKEIRASQQQQQKLKVKSPKKKSTPVKAQKASPKDSELSGGAHLQFFLTEFDSGAIMPNGDSPTSPQTSPLSLPCSSSTIVDSRNIPPFRLAAPAEEVPLDAAKGDFLNAADLQALMDEVEDGDADEDEELLRRQRIQSLHEERQRRMMREREQRLAKLEQTKRQQEAELAQKMSKETQEKKEREEAKRKWLERYEAEQVAKARAFAKASADKNRQRKLEEREGAQMQQEDPMTLKKLGQALDDKRRPAVPRFPKSSKPFAEETAQRQKEEQDALLAETKRKQQIELVAKSEAALRQRLAQQRQRELQERLRQEEQERLRAMQKAKVAEEAQLRLLRALELKQLALERGEKENSDEKDAVKGNKDKEKSSKSKKSKNSKKKNAAVVATNLDAGEEIPPEHMAAIAEWNHEVLPANGENAPNPDQGDGGPTAEDDFQFDEFIMHAEKAIIEKRPLTKSAPSTAPEPPVPASALEDEDIDPESTLEVNDELNRHTFADMLDDEASHYDWLDAFQVDTMGADADGEAVYDDGEYDEVLGSQPAGWLDLPIKPPSAPQGTENALNGVKSRVSKKSSAATVSNKKVVQALLKTRAKKIVAEADSVSQASSSNVRPVRIPASLKDTPYYGAYVKIAGPPPEKATAPSLSRPFKKWAAPETQGPTDKSAKQRKGKVAELLEMVAKARKKLGHNASNNDDESRLESLLSNEPLLTAPVAASGASVSSVLAAPALVLSPKWKPPPPVPVDFFLKGRLSSKAKTTATKGAVGASSSSKKSAFVVRTSSTYDYDIHEVQRSLESDAAMPRPADLESENSEAEAEEDDEAERKLNAECDVLRQRLENKIGAAMTAGHIKSPVGSSVTVKRSSTPPPVPVGGNTTMSAATALHHVGLHSDNYDVNSVAAALLQQWAEEDAAAADDAEQY